MQEKKTIRVWDLPVRVFHWSLVTMVALAFATSEIKGFLFKIHLAAGYAVIGLVVFRLAWGLVGTRYARFASFVRPWPAVRAHAAEVIEFKPARFLGHNPIGGWMIVLLLAVIVLLVSTGLFAEGRDHAGPFAALAGKQLAHVLRRLHDGFDSILWILVAVHVAGVVVESLLTGENLVRAMWTGQKEPWSPADAEAAAGPADAVRLAACLLVAIVAVGAILLA